MTLDKYPLLSFHLQVSNIEYNVIKTLLDRKQLKIASSFLMEHITLSEYQYNRIYSSLFTRAISEDQVANLLVNHHVMSHLERVRLVKCINYDNISEEEIISILTKIEKEQYNEFLLLTA
ncbi:MAG: hypothetical protein COW03_02495 [Cytophagales bacterium CG12_big_fil_rev_8_21_14_0_65_40_12]|nr:MAG: hypothetical protein COW03_02495 [Cytophagales bacterium CG12_big_fil_rev_8_21_14_0_65_40_12]PIW03414.1 MAG: hypothetical protein COW40_14740 [Cytophagales bacterium CG17_big_fil_post_rev_8_21_14_2_50_40_13]